jgi:hypothetical protein
MIASHSFELMPGKPNLGSARGSYAARGVAADAPSDLFGKTRLRVYQVSIQTLLKSSFGNLDKLK